MVLEEGMKPAPLSLTAEDLEVLEADQLSAENRYHLLTDRELAQTRRELRQKMLAASRLIELEARVNSG
jgi:hypothetical protein